MNTAYQKKWPLYLSTKNTILKKYDGRYSHIRILLMAPVILETPVSLHRFQPGPLPLAHFSSGFKPQVQGHIPGGVRGRVEVQV